MDRGIKEILYKVPECLSSRLNWVPPPPTPKARVAPPRARTQLGAGGEGGTLACVGGSRGTQFRRLEKILFYSILYSSTGKGISWLVRPPVHRNAEFMYPEMPWKTISVEAKQCIQHFLVVKHDDRAHTKPNTTLLIILKT